MLATRYLARDKIVEDIVIRVNGCFERSENGKPPPPYGREMQAIVAYLHWISKGVPIYADVPWLGVEPIQSAHKPDRWLARGPLLGRTLPAMAQTALERPSRQCCGDRTPTTTGPG